MQTGNNSPSAPLEDSVSATATSEWYDTLTINQPGKTGSGTVRYKFSVTGTKSANATQSFVVQHNGFTAPLTALGNNLFETGDLPFTYGSGFTLNTVLSVGSTGNGFANFFNTANLTAITPASATGATLVATSGGSSFTPVFNGGAVAVPEAGTLARLALPVALSVVSRRKKGA